MGNWETPYLKARVQFVGDYLSNTLDVSKTSSESLAGRLLLKNIENAYGVAAAHRILNHASQRLGKSRSELLSSFEIFSQNIIKVYGKEGKQFLDKISATESNI